jgi:hypothetical protein
MLEVSLTDTAVPAPKQLKVDRIAMDPARFEDIDDIVFINVNSKGTCKTRLLSQILTGGTEHLDSPLSSIDYIDIAMGINREVGHAAEITEFKYELPS